MREGCDGTGLARRAEGGQRWKTRERIRQENVMKDDEN